MGGARPWRTILNDKKLRKEFALGATLSSEAEQLSSADKARLRRSLSELTVLMTWIERQLQDAMDGDDFHALQQAAENNDVPAQRKLVATAWEKAMEVVQLKAGQWNAVARRAGAAPKKVNFKTYKCSTLSAKLSAAQRRERRQEEEEEEEAAE